MADPPRPDERGGGMYMVSEVGRSRPSSQIIVLFVLGSLFVGVVPAPAGADAVGVEVRSTFDHDFAQSKHDVYEELVVWELFKDIVRRIYRMDLTDGDVDEPEGIEEEDA